MPAFAVNCLEGAFVGALKCGGTVLPMRGIEKRKADSHRLAAFCFELSAYSFIYGKVLNA
jgi:hypothetical protein